MTRASWLTLSAVLLFLAPLTALDAAEPGCVVLEPEQLPELARALELGATTADQARRQLAGDGVEVSEKWDRELGGETNLVVEGLASMTPNNGMHYGEVSFLTGAANRDEYLHLKLRFARSGGAEPILYAFSVTTRADQAPSVCEPASSLAERLSEQQRPRTPPNLPPPRVKSTGYTFYPCTVDGHPVVVKCNDGGVKVTFNGVQIPLRTVEYEMILIE